MKTKHTPGPWSTSERANRMIDVIHHNNAKGAITHSLCRVQSRDSWIEESYANARLIAAAPDLLEALQGLVAICDDADCSHSALTAARAAIAKAGGV